VIGATEDELSDALDQSPVDALVTIGHVKELTAHLVGALPELIAVRPFDKEAHARGCWYRSGGPCDCTLKDTIFYRRTR